MAIQVNGTQVIGNSRELTNIASVDATTVATLNAAGLGGAASLNELSDVVVSTASPTVSTNPSTGVGTLWINETDGLTYVCIDATTGANIWASVSGDLGKYIPSQLPLATGGAVVTAGNFKRHTFTTSGNFVVTTEGDFNILVISAGGAGARGSSSKAGGGGGAGGYKYTANQPLSIGTYSITVPAGMAGTTTPPSTASSASFNSTASLSSTGGGMGGSEWSGYPTGSDGGSGGGSSSSNQTGGSGITGQGFGGGDSLDDAAGGGGGAGSAGITAASGASSPGGNGGAGLQPEATVGFDGTSYFAGGGGGGARFALGGTGGLGGGGNGGSDSPRIATQNGTVNTGSGGGGGGAFNENGGNGGSGIVIITYKFQS